MGARYIGLISGTSADAIDAALVEVGADGRPRILASGAAAWDDGLRDRILRFARRDAAVDVDDLATLDAEIGDAFAGAALALLASAGADPRSIRAIGSHGQTLRHRVDRAIPFTLQVGDPTRIAERTGITTVADFRRRDVAAGGQGAPLLPVLHAAAFARSGEPRAVLNLGGIANLTLLPGDDGPVRGFDTGPANCLLDATMAASGLGARDEGGRLAAGGRVDAASLDALLADPGSRSRRRRAPAASSSTSTGWPPVAAIVSLRCPCPTGSRRWPSCLPAPLRTPCTAFSRVRGGSWPAAAASTIRS